MKKAVVIMDRPDALMRGVTIHGVIDIRVAGAIVDSVSVINPDPWWKRAARSVRRWFR